MINIFLFKSFVFRTNHTLNNGILIYFVIFLISIKYVKITFFYETDGICH